MDSYVKMENAYHSGKLNKGNGCLKTTYKYDFCIMQLLLCSATELEINPTAQFIKNNNIRNVDILITGVGLMTSTYKLTRYLRDKRPDFILQAGIAGCLSDSFKLGEVVAVKSEMIGDLGVKENGSFMSVFDL